MRRQRNVHLRLVYQNGEVLETVYQRMVEELGIGQDVEFVGILGPAELAEEYQRADVLVLPSLAECLPSVVTEALLSGTPVVASAVGGIPEQVGEYGRVIPPATCLLLPMPSTVSCAIAPDSRHWLLKCTPMPKASSIRKPWFAPVSPSL